MSFSALRAPSSSVAAIVPAEPLVTDDPLLHAWQRIRDLRKTQFDANEPTVWLEEISRATADIHRLTLDHVHAAERSRLLARLAGTGSGPRHVAAKLNLADHSVLCGSAAHLSELCRSGRPTDIWFVVEVCEAAIALEVAVARHRNRLVEALESDPGPAWHMGRSAGLL